MPCGAGRDRARPTHDRGDAMAAFVNVALEAAERMGGPVVEFLGAGVGIFFRAIVGGENDESVVSLAGFFESRQQLADGVVGFGGGSSMPEPVAQKLFDADSAVECAVAIHGLAAEKLAQKRGQVCVRTTELLDYLPNALRSDF